MNTQVQNEWRLRNCAKEKLSYLIESILDISVLYCFNWEKFLLKYFVEFQLLSFAELAHLKQNCSKWYDSGWSINLCMLRYIPLNSFNCHKRVHIFHFSELNVIYFVKIRAQLLNLISQCTIVPLLWRFISNVLVCI